MQGFIDRFLTKQLPVDYQKVIIIAHDTPNPDFEVEAIWHKFDPKDYPVDKQPAKGFLGYFETEKFIYNIWEQNEHEIRYWKPIP